MRIPLEHWPSGEVGWHLDSSLLDCPFCGGTAGYKKIGNEHSKIRKIKVKCFECRVSRTDGALRHGFDWLIETAFKNWNQRPNHPH